MCRVNVRNFLVCTISTAVQVSAFYVCNSGFEIPFQSKRWSSPLSIAKLSSILHWRPASRTRLSSKFTIQASSLASSVHNRTSRTFRILIADSISSEVMENLRTAGHCILFLPDLDAASLPDATAKFEPHIIIVRSTRVTAATIAATGALEVRFNILRTNLG